MKPKIIFFIIDGLSDRPIPALGNKTCLEVAKIPHFDFLAFGGQSGLLIPLPGEEHPSSETAHFAIFGYDLKDEFPGRGPLEALGLNITLEGNEVIFRANFATLDRNGNLKDVRAGRIKNTNALCQAIDNIEIEGVIFKIYPSLEHRAVVVLRGEGITDQVWGNDPHKLPPFKIGVPLLPFKPKKETKEAIFTANILEKYIHKVQKILKNHPLNLEREKNNQEPANTLLLREGGKFLKVTPFEERWQVKACCVAGAPLYKGIGRFLGMDVFEVKGADGTPQTDLAGKFQKASKLLKFYDFVFLHVKACDLFGEDGNCEGKIQFIEKIDNFLPILMESDFTKLIITADHSTPCILKAHSGDPVPCLIYDRENQDETKRFTEKEALFGGLGKLQGSELLKLILEK
jgi:2,3-bisphosphoglycerate-independent phosphoglycerate mutase